MWRNGYRVRLLIGRLRVRAPPRTYPLLEKVEQKPLVNMRRVFEQLFISFAEKVVGVVCPSGQRSQTQVLMRKLREFKSHRNHVTFLVRLFAPLF